MTPITKLEWAAVLAVFLLAALLRLGYPGVNPFAGDEARLSVLALEMGREGHLIRTGIANSAGSRNLPASVYAFVPPYVLSTDPLFATQYVGVLNVLAIIGLWWVARRSLGPWAAWTAALFAAAAPYAVFFSRNIWTQNLLFPMAVAWMVSATIAITTAHQTHKRITIVLCCFLGVLAFQVHLAGAALGLATLYAVVRWRWWRNPLPVLIGIGLAALALLPFFYEAACCSPELLREYSAASSESGLDAQVIGYLVQAGVNHGWDYLAAGNLTQHGSAIVAAILSAMVLMCGAVAIARLWLGNKNGVVGARRASPLHKNVVLELGLLLLVTPIVLFTYHRAPVRLHYVLTALPALALLAGSSVLLIQRRWWPVLISGVLMTLAIIWSYQVLDSLRLVNEQSAPLGMNTPLKAPRDVAYSLPDDGRVVVMHTQSPDYYQRGEPAMWKVLLWNRPHRITNGWSVLLLPDEPAYLMTEIDGIHAWQEMRDTGIMDARLMRYDPLPGAQEHYMQPYDGVMLPPQAIMLDEPILFDSGLRLLGWYTRHVDGQVRVSMLYEAAANPPDDPMLRQFTHLYRAADVEAGNVSDPVDIDDIELTLSWQWGDRLVALAAFSPEGNSGTFYVDVGQYSLTTGQRYRHSGGADYLRFGPFAWSRE